MGLDMYMKAEKYVGGWKHCEDEEKALYKQIVQSVGTGKLATKESPSVTVSTTVAYWRKANAIHSWFVQNLAKGVDECQLIYVNVEDMEKLIAECKAALKLYDAGARCKGAEKPMQPVDGFFFGSTEIDEYWAEDLKDTIKQLTPLVDPEIETFDYYYQASW